MRIGEQTIAGDAPDVAKQIAAAIKAHGYPAGADPNDINHIMTVILLAILVVYVTMVYGPIAAWLVEMFPTRIRYSGVSLPYHIGNGWFGGFLPATVFAASVAATNANIASGAGARSPGAAMSFVVALIIMPETKDRDITRIWGSSCEHGMRRPLAAIFILVHCDRRNAERLSEGFGNRLTSPSDEPLAGDQADLQNCSSTQHLGLQDAVDKRVALDMVIQISGKSLPP